LAIRCGAVVIADILSAVHDPRFIGLNLLFTYLLTYLLNSEQNCSSALEIKRLNAANTAYSCAQPTFESQSPSIGTRAAAGPD